MGKRETLDGIVMNAFNFSGITASIFSEGEFAASSLGSEVNGGDDLL